MPDDDVSNLTPEQATAKLNEMTAAYRGAPPSANPTTPQEAKLKLESLTQSQEWREQLLSGNVEARRLFTSLTEMASQATDRLDNVLADKATPQPFEVTTPEQPLSTRDLQSGIDGLRERGLDDDVIREIMGDRVASKAEHNEVREFRRKRMGDAEWRKRLLAGDHEAMRELTLMSAVLSTPVEE